MEQTRIDKYMWAIRLFKTRSSATKACLAGKVKINGDSVKPSQNIAVGTVFTARVNYMLKSIQVDKVIDKRVGAKIAQECYTDLTPEEEIQNRKQRSAFTHEYRNRGVGRPTKKERREIEDFKEDTNFEGWEDW